MFQASHCHSNFQVVPHVWIRSSLSSDSHSLCPTYRNSDNSPETSVSLQRISVLIVYFLFVSPSSAEMGIAILPSQNCFQGRFRYEALTLTPLKPRRYSNTDSPQSRRQKRSPDRNRRDGSVAARFAAKNLVMGQVKILKRGETLSQTKSYDNRKPRAKKENDLNLVLRSTERLGPAPLTVQKCIRVSELKVVDEIYAGSAFVASPPPSCLPVPCFLGRNNGSATSDLRRLLRLDLV